MRATGGGSIVNTSSVSAFRGSVRRPSHAYAASKGAVLALTHAMAASYGRDRIRVNEICPGTIRTRLTADIIDHGEPEAAEGRGIPLGRGLLDQRCRDRGRRRRPRLRPVASGYSIGMKSEWRILPST